MAGIVKSTCLVESENVAGVETGDVFSNLQQLNDLGIEDLQLVAILNCQNEYGSVSGLQCIVSSKSDPGLTYYLDPIGLITEAGYCLRLNFTSPIDQIFASYNTSTEAVDSIRYLRTSTITYRTFGVLQEAQTTWLFDDDREVVGIHGRMEESKIKQLGFIMKEEESVCGGRD